MIFERNQAIRAGMQLIRFASFERFWSLGRFWFLALSLSLACPVFAESKPVHSESCSAYQHCDRIQDIYLPLVSGEVRRQVPELLSEPAFLWFRHAAPEGVPAEPIRVIHSGADLIERLSKLARGCKRVHTLAVLSHGREGRIFLGSQVMDSLSILREWKGAHCAMKPGATIALSGCEVARGCAGKQFARAMARSFLRGRGGRILWNDTVTIIGFPPPGSQTEVVEFSPDLELRSSTLRFPTSAECGREFRDRDGR